MSIADIVQSAFEDSPNGVKRAVDEVMQDKMGTALDDLRDEMTSTMFSVGGENEDD